MVFEKATKLLNFFKSCATGTFESQIIQNSILIGGHDSTGRIQLQFNLPVLPEFNNTYGPMHGGAITTTISQLTSIAIHTADRSTRDLSTIQLSISFASAAYTGEQLLIKTSCDKIGKNIGFSSAEIWSGSKLVASGKHTALMLEEVINLEEH